MVENERNLYQFIRTNPQKNIMRQLIWMALGAGIATVPYLLATSTISLHTFGLVALGMGLGVLLLVIVIILLWSHT